MKLILIILLISNISFAEDSVFLDKDKAAPFSGYLLPQEKVIELKNNTLDMNFYKKAYEVKTNQVDMLIPELNRSNEALLKTSSTNNWERVFYFVAGVAVSFLAIKEAQALR